MGLIKGLHLIGVTYFLGFLLLDAFVIRHFLDTQCHDKKLLFYEQAKSSLQIFVTVILASGFWMLYSLDFHPRAHIWVKIAVGVAAISLFFSAPYIVKKLPKDSAHYLYGVILALAVMVVVLAKA